MTGLIIPYEQLSLEALHGVVEDFVTRDGTDYGELEISLETKISQVSNQLKSGAAVMVFDTETQTCNILEKDNPALKIRHQNQEIKLSLFHL